jgi:predicted nucleic acid-binding protein
MNQYVLADSGFWIGLFNPDDQHHEASLNIADLLEGNTIVIPWPCLYESVTTRLMRRSDRAILFVAFLKKPNIRFLDDSPYRQQGLEDAFLFSKFYGKYSLADVVIRSMLADINNRIDWLVTFNDKDFLDICVKRGVKIMSA